MSTHSMHCCIALCAMMAFASATIITPPFTPHGTCDNFDAETLNEGMCYHRYQDSVGLWTIGIGFNMQQSGAASIMAKCFTSSSDAASTFNALNQGPNSCSYNGADSQKITKELAACLLYTELVAEETCVKGILGSQFENTPSQVRSGMIDMAYNMGCGGLKSFSTMIGLIKSGQYEAAASSARGSKWCSQVHGRCDRTTACISNKGGSSPPATGPSGGCFTFQSGLCPGPTDCQCSLGLSKQTCPTKASAQSVHNSTAIFEEKLAKLHAQGLAGSCEKMGGTCYTVVHGCTTDSTCLGQGDKC